MRTTCGKLPKLKVAVGLVAVPDGLRGPAVAIVDVLLGAENLNVARGAGGEQEGSARVDAGDEEVVRTLPDDESAAASQTLLRALHKQPGTWRQVFGPAADEMFQAHSAQLHHFAFEQR